MENAYINSVNLNQNTALPYLVLHVTDDESCPRNPGFQVMHWHEDLQFTYVITGEIEVVTLSERVLLRQGEGVLSTRMWYIWCERSAPVIITVLFSRNVF